RALAERGYYVFPVAVIDTVMKENGVPTPEDMAQVPLHKIREVIDPDAVLYVTIKDWGTKYRVIESATTIRLWAQLVDTDTATMLWEGERAVVQSSSQNQGSLAEMLAAAVVSQVVSSIVDPSRDAARTANTQLFGSSHNGLMFGARHSSYGEDQGP
ncbi:MAG: DUF799 family lipoprotein, partial [Thermodesulfobacteriota bacterium]|nr:DUF799 family lipoprotein [Thermodesulfobacteriota bacterium]